MAASELHADLWLTCYVATKLYVATANNHQAIPSSAILLAY